MNLLNPANPIGLTNPISPLYIGRDHGREATTELLPPPPERTTPTPIDPGPFLVVLGAVALLAVLMATAFWWLDRR